MVYLLTLVEKHLINLSINQNLVPREHQPSHIFKYLEVKILAESRTMENLKSYLWLQLQKWSLALKYLSLKETELFNMVHMRKQFLHIWYQLLPRPLYN